MIQIIIFLVWTTALVVSNGLFTLVRANGVMSDFLATSALKRQTAGTIEASAVDHTALPSYYCLSVQDELCLGISTTSDPAYNPSGLFHLQLKQRDNNEMKGLDFQKMRWKYGTLDGRIRLANYTTLCVAKMDKNDPREVVLRPCGANKALDMWKMSFSATGPNGNGTISLLSIPDQCLTVMRCVTTTLGHCDPAIDDPFTLPVFDKEALRGTFVKLAQCQPGNPSQMFQQIINCATGCSPTMQENSRCDPECQNLACAWDNGRCPIITPAPTRTNAPTISPTRYPTKKPTTSTPTKAPSTPHPSSAPVPSPTSGAPSNSPSRQPTTSTPSSAPTTKPSASPSSGPTANPSMTPTSVPSNNPTESPSTAPTTSQPTMTPSHRPTVSTMVPTTSPTEQNVTVLAATPLASSTTASDLWWVWLIIALLGICLCGSLIFMCMRSRNRREGEMEQARNLQEHEQAKLGGDGGVTEMDIEAIADSPTKVPHEESGTTKEATPPKQPSPTMNEPPPGSITQVKSSSPVIPPEFVEQRRQEDLREAKERRAARRSVMKLLSAMNELEDAFQTVEKELQTNVVADQEEAGKGEESAVDVENRIVLDGTPARMRANTSSPRKRAPLQPLSVNTEEIDRLAKKENHELMMEMRAQKINSAIQKVENAIGTLEQRIVHEKVKSMGKVTKQKSLRAPVQSHDLPRQRSAPQYHLDRLARMSGGSAMSSKSGGDTSFEDGLNTSSDSIAETRRLSTLIVGKTNRAGSMV